MLVYIWLTFLTCVVGLLVAPYAKKILPLVIYTQSKKLETEGDSEPENVKLKQKEWDEGVDNVLNYVPPKKIGVKIDE